MKEDYNEQEKIGTVFYHIIVCGMGIIMIYPLLWMIMSSFKESNTIFFNGQKSDTGAFYPG